MHLQKWLNYGKHYLSMYTKLKWSTNINFQQSMELTFHNSYIITKACDQTSTFLDRVQQLTQKLKWQCIFFFLCRVCFLSHKNGLLTGLTILVIQWMYYEKQKPFNRRWQIGWSLKYWWHQCFPSFCVVFFVIVVLLAFILCPVPNVGSPIRRWFAPGFVNYSRKW